MTLSSSFSYSTIIVQLHRLDYSVLLTLNQQRLRVLDSFLIALTDTAFIVAILIPTVLLMLGLYRRQPTLRMMASQLYLSLALSATVSTILKYSIHRTRPFVYHPMIEKLSTGGSPSFPSGHTADAFVMAVAVTIVAGKKPVVLIAVWLWAILVAYSRLALGVHYPSDVIGSMVIGLCSAFAGRWLMQRFFLNKYKASA